MNTIGNYIIVDKFFRIYKMDDEMQLQDLFKTISESSLEDINVYVDEDVDGEMKSIQGSYDLDDIIENGESILSNTLDYDGLTISFNGKYNNIRVSIVVSPKKREVTLVTKEKELGLNRVLSKESTHVK